MTTSTRFNLKVSHIFSKNIQPGKLHCIISHLKSNVSGVVFIGDGLALAWLQND